MVVITHAFPYLTVLILLPAGGALLAGLGGWRGVVPRAVVEWFGIAVSLAVLALTIVIAAFFSTSTGAFQFVSNHPWASGVGVRWELGVDGISLFLLLMAGVLFPIVLVGARTRQNAPGYVAWMLLLECACLGSFVATDLLLFFFFFELTLVPAYFIIAGWGHESRAYASLKFFIYTLLGSAFLLVGIVVVAIVHRSQTGVLTFSLPALEHTHFSSAEGILLFLAFTAAFAVKAPLFPFHTWSPDAYTQAPTGGSIVIAGVLAKLGTYGIFQFDLRLFPRASVDLAPLMLTVAVAGVLYGAIVACAQRDLKRLVAYSSLSHLGFVALGIFAFTTVGLTGGVLLMLNHGIVTAGLFLLIGWIYERRKTWQTHELRGLQAVAPFFAAAFTAIMLASIGLPGLNGFVSEFLVLSGTFITHRWWAVVATFGVILAAVYLLWAYQQVFHGKLDEKSKGTKDLGWGERAVIVPLILVIVFLGVYPKPVLERITPTVNALVAQVDAATGIHEPHPGAQEVVRYSKVLP